MDLKSLLAERLANREKERGEEKLAASVEYIRQDRRKRRWQAAVKALRANYDPTMIGLTFGMGTAVKLGKNWVLVMPISTEFLPEEHAYAADLKLGDKVPESLLMGGHNV